MPAIPPSGARRALGLGFVLAIAGAAWLSMPSAAAHGFLESSDPVDGAVLEEPPDAITLRFTEAPNPTLSSVRVVGQDDRLMEAGPPEATGDDDRAIRFPLEELSRGVYSVEWRVVSSVDGHLSAGAFVFGVRASPFALAPQGPPAPQTPGVSAVEGTGRSLFLIGLALMVGAAVVGLAVFAQAVSSVRRLVLVGFVMALVGVGMLAVALANAADIGLAALLDTPVGRSLVWRVVGVAAAAGGVAATLVRSGRARMIGLGIVAAGAAGAMYAESASGHAAAAASLPLLRVISQWVHIAAVGVWVGGLVALLAGIRGAPSEEKSRAIRRFSATAAITLGVVAATGVVRAFNELEEWNDLFDSTYGRVVLLKIVLLVLLLVLGGINRYRNVPRSTSSLTGLRRASWAEVTVAAGVIVAGGLLASLAPPRSIAAPPPPSSATGASVVVVGSQGDVEVELEVSPGFPGRNRFLARVTDARSGDPVSAQAIALRFRYLDASGQESSLDLEREEQGLYVGIGSNLNEAGHWAVDVVAAEDGVTVPVVMATRCRASILSGGDPVIYRLPLSHERHVQALLGGVGGSRYQVHFTFENPKGAEVPVVGKPAVSAWQPGAEPADLRVVRLSPGHFFGLASLEKGKWRFQATASLEKGEITRPCFTATVD